MAIAVDNHLKFPSNVSTVKLREMVKPLMAPDVATMPGSSLPATCFGTNDRVHCIYLNERGCPMNCQTTTPVPTSPLDQSKRP